ncbi:MAG TPA: DUF2269 family protein [Candidatus Baltobacteraceae bacterium]|nr:DUF2269 family protein [Candidatus Baltobacteraceae bacterium]
MLQTLLFFHVLAVAGLFVGLSIEIAALVRVHRAQTLSDARAALLNVPIVGPVMGMSVLLLLAMGISMIYVGGFGWTAAWINIVFGLTIVLAIIGPAVSGRRVDALHALAASAGEGPITPEVDAGRRDRLLNYMVFLSLFEVIAALYIMITKPELAPAITVVVAAAVFAGVPAALLLRRTSTPAVERT